MLGRRFDIKGYRLYGVLLLSVLTPVGVNVPTSAVVKRIAMGYTVSLRSLLVAHNNMQSLCGWDKNAC